MHPLWQATVQANGDSPSAQKALSVLGAGSWPHLLHAMPGHSWSRPTCCAQVNMVLGAMAPQAEGELPAAVDAAGVAPAVAPAAVDAAGVASAVAPGAGVAAGVASGVPPAVVAAGVAPAVAVVVEEVVDEEEEELVLVLVLVVVEELLVENWALVL